MGENVRPPDSCLRRGKLFQLRAFTLQEDGFDPWHIHLRFCGQMSGNVVVTSRFAAIHQLLHGAFSRVVSRQRQAPVLNTIERIFQVLGGGGRAGFGLETLIERPQGKSEPFRRVGRQLKQSRRSRWTFRALVKGRFPSHGRMHAGTFRTEAREGAVCKQTGRRYWIVFIARGKAAVPSERRL